MAKSDDTQQMLRAIINGQSSFRQEVLGKIDKLDQKLTFRMDGLEGKIESVEKNLTKRIDRIGKQLAYLEDDTPAREEFDKLGSRVDKINQAAPSVLA
jgi:DNA repair exonuclease SbcCD ATPase subunit